MIVTVFLFILLSLNLLLSLFVFTRNPKNHSNIAFALFTFFTALWMVVNQLSNQFTDYNTAFLFNKLIFIFSPYIVFSLLYFAIVFPKDVWKMSIKKVLLLITPVVISNVLTMSNLVIKDITFIKGQGTGVVFSFGIIYFTIQFIVYLLGAITLLLIKLHKANKYERVQMQYLLFGVSLFLITATITNLIIPLIFNIFWPSNFGPFLSFATLGFTAFVIFKHRFLDIRLVVARSVAYSLLIILLGAIYSIGLFFSSKYFTGEITTTTSLLTSTVFALIIAFSFQILSRALEQITVHIFYRQRYNSQALLFTISRIMASKIILGELVEEILKKLFSEMKIASGVLILTKDLSIIWSQGIGSSTDIHREEQKMCSLIDTIVKNPGENLLVLDELDDSVEKNLMRDYGLSIILPLVVHDKPIGAILLGNKASGDIYSSEDLDVLRILAPEIAVAVQNARSYDEISKFNITLKEEVAKATKELKDLTEQQKDQVDIMGHEVKTPLTAISQQLNLLLEMILTEQKQQEWLKGNIHLEDAQRVIEGLKKMRIAETQEESIVTNMIEAARLDKLRFELNYSTFDLIDMVKSAIKDSENRLGTTKQEGKIHLQTDLKTLQVEADQTRIRQCIDGLLTNAEKYGKNPQTHTSSIRVTIETDNKNVTVAVHDQGIGIDAKDMDKLGKKFSRLNSHSNDNRLPRPGGTGLGLYTYKGIIEHHGGTLSVASDGIGKGSTFTLTLPIKPVR